MFSNVIIIQKYMLMFLIVLFLKNTAIGSITKARLPNHLRIATPIVSPFKAFRTESS